MEEGGRENSEKVIKKKTNDNKPYTAIILLGRLLR